MDIQSLIHIQVYSLEVSQCIPASMSIQLDRLSDDIDCWHHKGWVDMGFEARFELLQFLLFLWTTFKII